MTSRIKRSATRSRPAVTRVSVAEAWGRVRLAALAVAGVDLLAVASIAAFFTVGGPFGAANDVANGAVGVLSLVLAGELARASRSGPTDVLLVGLAGAGGAISVTGTYLVVTESTGWYLAGLVSGLGNAMIGAWLLGSSLRKGDAAGGHAVDSDAEDSDAANASTRALRRLGAVAGGVMLLGLAGLPGVIGGVDDAQSASWLVNAGFVGWIGTYALYPAWCLRVARRAGGLSRVGRAWGRA